MEKTITLHIIEKCLVDAIVMEDYDKDQEELYSIREYLYATKGTNFGEAMLEYLNEFDSINILKANDHFVGEFLDGDVVEVKVYEY